MKFIREVTPKGLYIPAAALKIGQYEVGDKLDLFASEDAMILLRKQMTAMELINAAEYLQRTASKLITHLANVCGSCDDCFDGECPYRNWDDDAINLPEYLRKEAGIPKDAKLCAIADEETCAVIITEAGEDCDLGDVPPVLREVFECAGICLGALDDVICEEEVVYGE